MNDNYNKFGQTCSIRYHDADHGCYIASANVIFDSESFNVIHNVLIVFHINGKCGISVRTSKCSGIYCTRFSILSHIE